VSFSKKDVLRSGQVTAFFDGWGWPSLSPRLLRSRPRGFASAMEDRVLPVAFRRLLGFKFPLITARAVFVLLFFKDLLLTEVPPFFGTSILPNEASFLRGLPAFPPIDTTRFLHLTSPLATASFCIFLFSFFFFLLVGVRSSLF